MAVCDGADRWGRGLRRLAIELTAFALVANHLFQQRLAIEQFAGQFQQFQNALVVELDPALRIEHGHACSMFCSVACSRSDLVLQRCGTLARGTFGLHQPLPLERAVQ